MVSFVVLLALQAKAAPDVSRVAISREPVGGKIGGKAFRPSRVVFTRLGPTTVSLGGKVADRSVQHTLKFQVGEGFMPDEEVSVCVTFDEGKPLAPRQWNWKPYAFSSEEYRKQSYRPGANGSVGRGITTVMTSMKNGIFNDRFSAHLRFERVVGDTLHGSIALVLPDKAQSYLNGRFQAKIERN